MVQLEVADRLAAAPGTRDYGLLTATANLYGHIEKLFTLPPEAFSPPPQVSSAVVQIDVAPRFVELQVDEHGFIEFLKQSFAQKRKMLTSVLREHYSPAVLKQAAAEAGIQPGVRAEAMSLDKMAALYRSLTASHSRLAG